jgi:hypothetical protein
VTGTTALAEARRRDVARRRQRVHRSFIHRHPDLRAAVIAAAEDPSASRPAGASAVSRRSLQADNANLRDRARRLEQHARRLEGRLSEILGTQITQRTGLGPRPTSPR